MNRFLLFLFLLIPLPVLGVGYTDYDSTKQANGQTYYMYDLPPRYIGDLNFNNFTRMIIYRNTPNNYSYEVYKDKWISNNQYVGEQFKNNLQINNDNLFTYVSNQFNYNMYTNNLAQNNPNQRNFALQFSVGENVTTTDDMFYNPTTIKNDAYYDFDFDIYLYVSNSDNTVNFMESYNTQGFACHNANSYDLGGSPTDFNCWVDRYSTGHGSTNGLNYYKTTYHVTHGKFMPDDYKEELPNKFKTNNDNDWYNDEYTYFFPNPFMLNHYNNESWQVEGYFQFWVSTPYNIKYYSNDKQIFLNGDRIRNTDSFNNAQTCNDPSCQDSNYEQTLFDRLFSIKLVNDFGFARILQTITDFFNMFLNYNYESGFCNNLDLDINIRNNHTHIYIPSGCSFWTRNDNIFKTTYELIINGMVAYLVFMKIYQELLRIANPDWLPTNKELMKL